MPTSTVTTRSGIQLTCSLLFLRRSLPGPCGAGPLQYPEPNSTFANKEKVWKVSSPVFPRSAEQLETRKRSRFSKCVIHACPPRAPSLVGCLQREQEKKAEDRKIAELQKEIIENRRNEELEAHAVANGVRCLPPDA